MTDRAWFWGIMAALSGVASAQVVDHFSITPVSSPQRAGVPFQVTVTALDSNNVVVTDYSSPLQFFFADQPNVVLEDSFPNSSSFDTDGDGISDPSGKRMKVEDTVTTTYSMNLASNTMYSFSVDFAVDPGSNTGVRVNGDAGIYYIGNYGHQISGWDSHTVPANQITRWRAYSEFVSLREGQHYLDLRYYGTFGNGPPPLWIWIYTDNIRVRKRDVTPGYVHLSGGQWTGDLSVFRAGTNLVLRTQNNSGILGDTAPFDVLPRVADVSVSIPPHGYLPVGEWAWIHVPLTNVGPSSIEYVTVTNELPSDIQLIQTVPWGGTKVESNRVITIVGQVAGATEKDFELIVQRDQAGEAVITADLSVPDYDQTDVGHHATRELMFVPVLTGSDVTVAEVAGDTNATLTFSLNVEGTQDLEIDYSVLPLTATPGTDYGDLPDGSLLFLQGSTQQSLSIPVLDDPFDEVSEEFAVQISVGDSAPIILKQTNFVVTILDDEPLPSLTVSMPPSAHETDGILTNAGALALSGPFENDIGVVLTSEDPGEILSPGTIVIPAGQTNAVFSITVVDDGVFHPDQTVTINATCTNGLAGSAAITVTDDEPPYLTVTAAFKPTEGNGVVVNGMRVVIPITLATNLTVSLSSGDTTEILVPEAIVIPPGATFTSFSPEIVDDLDTDGVQTVVVTAVAPGFTGATNMFSVSDNDVHHFIVLPLQGETIPDQTSAVPFWLRIEASDINGVPLNSFTGSAGLSATGDLGQVALSVTNTGPFGRLGRWSGQVAITNGDNTNVRIIASDGAGHFGETNPFDVHANEAQKLELLSAQVDGSDIRIQFNSVAWRNYRLEASAHPVSTNWDIVVPSVIGTGGALEVIDADGAGRDARFYRVALQP